MHWSVIIPETIETIDSGFNIKRRHGRWDK